MPAATEKTLILQSQRLPLRHAWMQTCLDSVRDWASRQGYAYEFLDDALFDVLPADLLDVRRSQPVVASDLARLRWLQRRLADGWMRVLWCDSDTLMLGAPDLSAACGAGWACGREIWLQQDGDRLRRFTKVHNAFLLFARGNSMLDFYADAAERLVRRHRRERRGPMVPQLAGPKFLTALHNILQLPVIESAQVLSPPLAAALLGGDRLAIDRYCDALQATPAAFNLCASEVSAGRLGDAEMTRLCGRLLEPEGPAAQLCPRSANL